MRLVGGDSLSSLTKTNLLLYTLYTQYIFSCILHVTTQVVMDRQIKILELDRVFFLSIYHSYLGVFKSLTSRSIPKNERQSACQPRLINYGN